MISLSTTTKNSPHSAQLQKAHAQHQRPSATKNKNNNNKKESTFKELMVHLEGRVVSIQEISATNFSKSALSFIAPRSFAKFLKLMVYPSYVCNLYWVSLYGITLYTSPSNHSSYRIRIIRTLYKTIISKGREHLFYLLHPAQYLEPVFASGKIRHTMIK